MFSNGVYATSVDYDPATDVSQRFFAAVQNKIHWAAHGHTAAEIIHKRADAKKPNMGMTSWPGGKPQKIDAEIAKNYLDEKELDVLNRLVTIGRMILERQEREGWGASVIPRLARDLRNELPEVKGFSERNIGYMIRFAREYSASPILQQADAKLQQTENNDGKKCHSLWQKYQATALN